MGEIIIGSEAIAAGVVTRHELARWYRPVHPNVHAPRDRVLTLRDRTVAAWLWSRRRGVIAGAAAAALHGAGFVADDARVDLIYNRTHPPRGVITRNEAVAEDEIGWACKLPVTTPARTAFDLGRHLDRLDALVGLDALMRATPFSPEDVRLLAKRYRGARGLRQLREVLPLVDGGSASPRETRLRLLFIDAGLPNPTTQIPICGDRGKLIRMVDMGWEDFMVAAEYDGDQHRTSRAQYVKDLRVLPILERMGWHIIRAIKEDSDDEIVDRVQKALRRRGWNGRV
jgi:hypothetical protein